MMCTIDYSMCVLVLITIQHLCAKLNLHPQVLVSLLILLDHWILVIYIDDILATGNACNPINAINNAIYNAVHVKSQHVYIIVYM